MDFLRVIMIVALLVCGLTAILNSWKLTLKMDSRHDRLRYQAKLVAGIGGVSAIIPVTFEFHRWAILFVMGVIATVVCYVYLTYKVHSSTTGNGARE